MTPSLPLLKIPDERRHAIDILPEGGVAAILHQFMLLKGHKIGTGQPISLLFIKKSLILLGLTLSHPDLVDAAKAPQTGECPRDSAAYGAIAAMVSNVRAADEARHRIENTRLERRFRFASLVCPNRQADRRTSNGRPATTTWPSNCIRQFRREWMLGSAVPGLRDR
jgi:hypothetical protein